MNYQMKYISNKKLSNTDKPYSIEKSHLDIVSRFQVSISAGLYAIKTAMGSAGCFGSLVAGVGIPGPLHSWENLK